MNQQLHHIEPTSVLLSAPKFKPTEIGRIEQGLQTLADFDAKLSEIENLRDAIRESGRAYARGEISLGQAAALAGIDPMSVADTRGALRVGIKALMRETIEGLADLVTKAREHDVADLAARCSKMEKAERDNCRAIGIGDDDFRPSGLLIGLREQHRRTLRDSTGTITRSNVNTVAKAIGITSAPPLVVDAEAEDEDFLG